MNEYIEEKLDNFFKIYKHQVYRKGEILVRADDNPVGIFYLKKGNVKQYTISKKGEEVIVNIFKPTAFFPMSWAINKTPNVYFFEAMNDVEVWRAPEEDVIVFIKNNSDVLYDLISRVYRGVDGVLTRMTHIMSGDAYTRLIAELLIYSKRFGKGKNVVELHVTEKDLAAQAGMTRETVSREMKVLKDKGLVVLKTNKLILKDVLKLEDEMDS
jgi:CRP/FNR family transcriptional regulator